MLCWTTRSTSSLADNLIAATVIDMLSKLRCVYSFAIGVDLYLESIYIACRPTTTGYWTHLLATCVAQPLYSDSYRYRLTMLSILLRAFRASSHSRLHLAAAAAFIDVNIASDIQSLRNRFAYARAQQSHVVSVTFNQPMFSNNHIAIAFHPVADGGLPQSLVPSPTARSTPTPVELKLVFREGRMHEAYKVMEEWRVTAKQRPRRGEEENVDPLRECQVWLVVLDLRGADLNRWYSALYRKRTVFRRWRACIGIIIIATSVVRLTDC